MRAFRPKRLVFGDVFAGCGGLSLGLLQAGLEGRFAIEHDRFAFATLRENLLSKNARFTFRWPRWLPQEPAGIGTILKDFRSELASMEGSIDVLVGGPPCQGFSTAGRRRHDDPRNQLFAAYLELVNILKPKAVLIENVRGFTMDFDSEKTVHNYSQKLRENLSLRYDVYDRLLNLSQFGVPQQRVRYFLLAVDPDLVEFDPFELLLAKLPSFLRSLSLKTPVSSWSAISDLEIGRGGTRPSRDTPGFREIRYTTPRTHYQRLMNEQMSCPTDLRVARHSDEIATRFRDIIDTSHAEGRLNTTISDRIRARYGLQKKALRVLDPDRPAPTITSLPDDLLHYGEARILTVRENARLQTFPDWFEFKGKYTTGGKLRRKEVPRYTQVANAVPPLVARAVGEMLIDLFGMNTRSRTRLTLQGRKQLPEIRT